MKNRCLGRPKRKPMSATELRAKALINRARSVADRAELDPVEAEDTIARMMDENGLKRMRESDIKELRRQAKALWEKLERETWQHEQVCSHPNDSHLTDEEFLDAPTIAGQMTRREWLEEHKPTLPKRKNARKPKSIADIKPQKFEQYGLIAELDPGQDLDAMERELEIKLMEQAIKDREEERKFSPPLGKRMREAQRESPCPSCQNFWI